MKNKFLLLFLAIIFIGIAFFEGLPQRFGNWVKSEKHWQGFMSQVSVPESLSGTLRGPLDNNSSNLTQAGVIEETNKQRELYKQPALHMNSKLNLAAKAKLDDMFRQQYFEHESPDGKHPADVIKASGYEYLVVGENLALGNYENDQVLVEAWMNSPGHRANILDGKFDEIGVAVGKGMFEGKEVWLAVQEFGTPLSSCPGPSSSLKSQIDRNRQNITAMEAELDKQKAAIQANRYPSREARDQAIGDYNAQAARLNELIDSTKSLVNDYNAQVNSFNKCLDSDG